MVQLLKLIVQRKFNKLSRAKKTQVRGHTEPPMKIKDLFISLKFVPLQLFATRTLQVKRSIKQYYKKNLLPAFANSETPPSSA